MSDNAGDYCYVEITVDVRNNAVVPQVITDGVMMGWNLTIFKIASEGGDDDEYEFWYEKYIDKEASDTLHDIFFNHLETA